MAAAPCAAARASPCAVLAKLPVGPKLPLHPLNLDLELLALLIPSLVECSQQPTEPTIGQGQRLDEPRPGDVAWKALVSFLPSSVTCFGSASIRSFVQLAPSQ